MALPDSITERARQGAQVRREVLGAAYVDAGRQKANPFTQHFIEFTQTQCWGNVWLREGLSRKTRSMLNVCMLAALARWHEFEVHIRGALNNGVTARGDRRDPAAHRRLCRHPDRLGRLPPRQPDHRRSRGGTEKLRRVPDRSKAHICAANAWSSIGATAADPLKLYSRDTASLSALRTRSFPPPAPSPWPAPIRPGRHRNAPSRR